MDISPNTDMNEDDDLSMNSSMSEADDEYTVDRILTQQIDDDGQEMYLVRWEGFPDEECTWEPAESFLNETTLPLWQSQRSEGKELSSSDLNVVLGKMKAYEKLIAEERRIKLSRRWQGTKKRTTSIGDTPDHAEPLPTFEGTETMHNTIESYTSDEVQGSVRVPRPPRRRVHSSERGKTNMIPIVPKPAAPNVFVGVGIVPRARKTTRIMHPRALASKNAEPTRVFRNLATQRRYHKARRMEPAPDPSVLQLRSGAEWALNGGETTALNLPPTNHAPVEHGQNTTSGNSHPCTLLANRPIAANQGSLVERPDVTSFKAQDINLGKVNNSAKVPGFQGMRYGSEGRFWEYGEVVVNLKFGANDIGDVRIKGLDCWSCRKIILLKPPTAKKILMQVANHDIVTKAQYTQLCTGRSNEIFANAHIIPYDDTRTSVEEMAQYLGSRNWAALWYHPDPEVSLVLVIYATGSHDWHFLDSGQSFPSDVAIRVVARTGMPSTKTLETPSLLALKKAARKPHGEVLGAQNLPPAKMTPGTGMFQAARVQVVEPAPGIFGCGPKSEGVNGADNTSSTNNIVRDSETPQPQATQNIDTSDNIAPAGFPRTVSTDSEDISLPEPMDVERPPFRFDVAADGDVDQSFQERFNFEYNYLTTVPTSKSKLGKARFYLVFPKKALDEMNALVRLLEKHTTKRYICTSMEKWGWDDFKELLEAAAPGFTNVGVIVYYATATHYFSFGGLGKMLKSSSIHVFRMCLSKPLPHNDDAVYIERLFSSGMAILITEATMSQNPDHTLQIMRWFLEKARQSGARKLFLRPSIASWLRAAALRQTSKAERYLEMLTEVLSEAPIHPTHYERDQSSGSEAESYDGTDEEDGQPSFLVSPAFIPKYDRAPKAEEMAQDVHNEIVLVEFFAGWACVHAQHHRRFVAITPMSTDPALKKKWAKWGHIEVVNAETFIKSNKVLADGSETGVQS